MVRPRLRFDNIDNIIYNINVPKYKLVRVKQQTWNDLVALKKGMQSLDDVIQNLLKERKRDK